MKESKELQDITKALNNYLTKHKGDVVIHCAVCAFDKDDKIIDDRVYAKGLKKILLISITEMKNEMMKEKKEFVDW